MKAKSSLTLLLLLFIFYVIYAIAPISGPTDKTIIVTKGESKLEIAKNLHKNKVIWWQNGYWFLEQLMSISGYIKAGEYNIPANSSPFSIINMMIEGNIVIRKITIPEGWTNTQIIDLIKSETNLQGSITKSYEEGDFLPNTYYYNLGDTKQQMLDKMHLALTEQLELLWPTRSLELGIKNHKQLLTMASIIEKETKHDEERPLVASVFYNRLKIGMPLQADPTTIYAITKGKYTLDRPLTKTDLKIDSPFNTYAVRGLPPTPIANSGIQSIKAALNPAKTNYLYFVANGDAKHSFAAKLDEHNHNVRVYRLTSK